MSDFAAACAEIIESLGEIVTLKRLGGGTLAGLSVVIDRDVEVVGDNGFAVTKRTIVQFIKSEVTKVASGDVLELGNGDKLTLMDTISDDNMVLQVYARPVN